MNLPNHSIFIAICCLFFESPAHTAEAFLSPPEIIEAPDKAHSLSTRKFQGIPSLAIAPNGRHWATWYAGETPGEDMNNYVVLSTTEHRDGDWQEHLYVDPDDKGPVRAFDPQVWLAPNGRLWFFWAQAIGHDGTVAGVWAMTCDEPGRSNPDWSEPRRITDGIMMNKPLVLSSGEWILPASTWRKTDNSARLIVSTNEGRTWTLRGACHVPEEVRSFDEHMIVEKNDGSLWMLVRTSYGIGKSVSTDKGRSWSPLTPSSIQNPTARFFIRRLDSGTLLLVKNGPIDERTGRSHMTAFVSRDDGNTWSDGLLLDERNRISYPDGQQATDGVVSIIYDHDRTGAREILMANFSEQDVVKSELDSREGALRRVISRHPEGGIEK